MYTASAVDKMIKEWKSQGMNNIQLVKKIANACLGWSYVFGAVGEKCTPQNRRNYYAKKGKPTIKSKCKNFDGNAGCGGCQWYPGGETRFFDCRGFTRWLFNQIGIKIAGAGCTSQYTDDINWSEKGPIENMPKNKVCIVFRYDSSTKKYEHTLFYDGEGHYIHDNGTVKKISDSQYKATHYAIPKGLYTGANDEMIPEPIVTTPIESTPVETKPVQNTTTHKTLRKGKKGSEVKEMQTLLLKHGYQLPKFGTDGDFGNETLAAVKAFQKDHNLVVDGIVGPKTWAELLKTK